MKWIFLVLLISAVPVLAGWLRENPRHAPKAWMVMGFLPFVLDPWNLGVAPFFTEWRGIAQGTEITLLDVMALSVLLSRPPSRIKLPFKLLIFAYLLAVLVSGLQAAVPVATLYYAWQIGRMTLLFFAIARICEDDRGFPSLIAGLVVGLSYQFAYAMSGRFIHGMPQSGGTFGHQNMLGMASHFVVFPVLALLLSGDRSWPAKLGPLAGLGTQIVTASRATIGFAGIGYVVLFLLSGIRRWTARKALVAGAGLLIMGVAAPLATASLESRFGSASISFDKEAGQRGTMERATWSMIADHPYGIGANQFVNVANLGGYWGHAHVGFENSRSMVHNAYLLTIAELGYLGSVPLFLLLGAAVVRCLITGLRHKKDGRAEIMLGLGVAIAVAALHSFYEFVMLTPQVLQLLFIDLGIAAALSQKINADANGRIMQAGAPARELRPARTAMDLPTLPAQRAGRPPLP